MGPVPEFVPELVVRGIPFSPLLSYRVIHLLVDRVRVDLNFECSTVCPVLLGLMGIWQKQLGKMVERPNQSQPNHKSTTTSRWDILYNNATVPLRLSNIFSAAHNHKSVIVIPVVAEAILSGWRLHPSSELAH